jgi:hypothetical protein
MPFSPVDHGVTEEEPAKEYEGQYSEPEPEDHTASRKPPPLTRT